MSDMERERNYEERLGASEERLRLGEIAGGIATFEYEYADATWNWSAQAAAIFGLENQKLDHWEKAVFIDDIPKVHAAVEAARQGLDCYVEFRVKHPDGTMHWIAAKGQIGTEPRRRLRGAIYEITARKALEVRLLAVNETLEARVTELRQQARNLEILNETGVAVAAERDLTTLVQTVTDAGVQLTHAEFGAFFYNVVREDGEAYTLYTLSGAPREAFSKFPMPRNTAIFEPTFRGRGPLRSDDILADPRYGKNAPHKGMPEGHLPVRSYLAVSVVSRSGEVLGGLFFGHSQPRVFTDRAERIVSGLAAQAAVAIDNARLYQANQQEIEFRQKAEQELQRSNQTLEQRVEQRARELAASQTKLEETERRFRLLVESVTDYAIYMLDSQGCIVNWNAGAERIKGYAPGEVISHHFSKFYTDEERAKGIPAKALAIAATSGKYEAEGWRVRKDGTNFWAGVVINAIKSSKGELLGFAKVTRDLTERRAADERARQAQKMEGIGQLTGGVAHDFNNLLTIIIGNLETLQRNLDADPLPVERLKRSAGNAMRGSRRAESLTQRLLAFSRQTPLAPKPIDISRLVGGLSDLLRRTLGEQVAVEAVLGGGLWRANVDPNQLEVAIINLAVNARDAMPRGGRLTIETANVYLDESYAVRQVEVVPGQYVMVAVTDSGSGMTPEVLAKAFDPFFTTKDVGHGTGLGLSQVYGFAKQSGGHVKIYSEIGEGTTVKLYFPRVHTAISQDEIEATTALVRGLAHETILVVEDDPDVRNYGCEMLRELGYNILEAENGELGLKLLDAHPHIKLLFTDVGLPGGMNGRQLADEARRRRPDLQVLFTTAYARNAIVHDGRLDPGVDLITKPYSQAVLLSKLRDMLDAREGPSRVLLVEDEPLIQMLAVDFLEDAGLKVDTASTAREALNKLALSSGGFAAVIIDVGLPDRSGDDLAHEIRSMHSSLPIVVATGKGAKDVGEIFRDMKHIVFLGKPYRAEDLYRALRTLHVAIPAEAGKDENAPDLSI
jgi:PAS domain S-box-containing protein